MLKDEWQGLYLEYLMALINNYSKCFEYTQELLHKSQKLLVSAEDEETLHGEFDLVAARFTLLADRTVDALANTIFEDLEEALKMLFKKEWYEEDITGQIIETLKDYFENEVKGHITEASFSKLAKECIERFLRRYVSELFNKKALPLSKKTVDRLKEDEELLRDLCRKHTNLREKHYKIYLQLLSDIRELLDSEPHMIVMYFNQLMQHNKDATLTMLTSLIQRRTDLDKGKMKEAIEACTQAAASIQEKRDNNEKEKGEDTEGREKNTLDASPREKTTGFFADVSTPTLSSKLQSVQNLLKKEDRK
ncbi:SNARE-binding exocyst subunit S6 [Balamuthia mandrillaris]